MNIGENGRNLFSRRDFLRMAEFVAVAAGIGACTSEQTRLYLTHPDIPWASLSFKSELPVRTLEISWEAFLGASDHYKIPRTNMRDLNIVISHVFPPEYPNAFNYFNDAKHVSITLSEGNQADIEIAGRVVIEEVRNQENQRPTAGGDQTWTKILPSNLMSHAIFLGYSMVGVQRGILEQQFLEETPLKYYNDMADGKAKPFIEMELKPLAGTLNI